MQRLLDAITEAPALAQNGRGDILATNLLGRALYSEMCVDPVRPANHARFIFLSPRSQDFYADWEQAANDTVAIHTTEALHISLVSSRPKATSSGPDGPLRTCAHLTGVKHVHHPVVGDLGLTYEMLGLAADSGIAILTYTADPGSKSAEALKLLGSWERRSTRPSPPARQRRPESVGLSPPAARCQNPLGTSFSRRGRE